MVGIGTLFVLIALVYLVVWIRRRRLPESRLFYAAVVLAGPLSVVALIAGWVTTEVGRQPWVVYHVMTTAQAVTGARGIPVGYGVLAASYLAVACGLVWVLRRLARAPLTCQSIRRLAARAERGVAMALQALPMVFVLCGLVLYAVLGGADFGAGVWQLLAGRSRRGEEVREFAHHSMGPVWEANHVWLIFVLTVFWTAYPRAFGSIASTLAVPLFIAVIGIVFRGAAYACGQGQRATARPASSTPSSRCPRSSPHSRSARRSAGSRPIASPWAMRRGTRSPAG